MINSTTDNLILKYSNFITPQNILSSKWVIESIHNDIIHVKRTTPLVKETIRNKKVKFNTHTKVGYINKESIKCKRIEYDDSIMYGNPPSSIQYMVDDMLLNICRINTEHLQSKEKIIFLLHHSNCYYYIMAELLNMHYCFSHNMNKILYTKRILLTCKSLTLIESFLIYKTDILNKINTIYKFGKYIGKINKLKN